MNQMGRRQFCAALGAGIVGLSGVLTAGCSSTNGNTASTSADASDTLADLSFAVRRDPG